MPHRPRQAGPASTAAEAEAAVVSATLAEAAEETEAASASRSTGESAGEAAGEATALEGAVAGEPAEPCLRRRRRSGTGADCRNERCRKEKRDPLRESLLHQKTTSQSR